MIQAMIVDDEYLIRERLKVGVDWQELGFEIAGEAENGEEALLLLEHAPIRLAIVDINMPIVDGLAFAKAAQHRFPELRIIVLTGYGSFDYARTALQAGVSDYLLKPVNMEELTQVLTAMSAKIREDMARHLQQEDFRQSVRESNTILRRTFIQSLLDGTGPGGPEHSPDKWRQFCPNLRDDALLAMVFSIDKSPGDGKEQPPWKRFAVFNIVGELFSGLRPCELTLDDDDRTVLLVHPHDGNSREKEWLERRGAEAVEAVRRFLKFTVTAGIGNAAQGPGGIPQSYKEAVLACKHRTILVGDRVIPFERLPKPALKADLSFIRETLMVQLRLGNKAAVEHELRQWLEGIVRQKLSLDTLYMTVYELVATLNLYAAESKLDMTFYGGDTFNPVQLVDELERMEEIADWAAVLFGRVLEQTHSLKQSTPAKLVDKAKQFIDGQYADPDLDLNAIAKSIFIHPSYLSRIFKNETGYSVVEYMTRRRLNKAKEMMENGCKNLLFVSESVGYKDPHYFSKCFKKHFSVPPSRFTGSDSRE